MPEAKQLRSAIVGAGLMGRWHAEAAQISGARVVIVVDSDKQKAEALAKRFGAQSTDVTSAGCSLDVADIVHVCTPPRDHEPVLRVALAAGLHAIVEKPLAASAAITAELYALAAEHHVRLCPTHQFLFQSGIQRLLENKTALGNLCDLSIVSCTAGADDKSAGERDQIAFDILPHPLSLAARILSHRLSGVRWKSLRSRPGELQTIGISGGTSISIRISSHGRPTRNTLILTGDRATWHADLYHGFGFEEEATISRASKMARPFALAARTLAAASENAARRAVTTETAFPGLRDLVRKFYESVQTAGELPVTVSEALDVAAARDTIMGELSR